MGLYNPSEIQSAVATIPKIDHWNSYVAEVATAWEEILSSEAYRRKLIIWNKGGNTVLISYGTLASLPGVDEGAFPIKPGGVFIDEYPAYTGVYKARTEQGETLLSIKELTELSNNG